MFYVFSLFSYLRVEVYILWFFGQPTHIAASSRDRGEKRKSRNSFVRPINFLRLDSFDTKSIFCHLDLGCNTLPAIRRRLVWSS